MRAFVAIDLPDATLAALEALQDDLPVGRLMAPETLHITLAFLGDQPQAVLEVLHGELGAVAATPFRIALRGVDLFGGKAPRLVWAGVAPSPALTELRNRIRRAAAEAGIELPRERFRPHVTLARFPPQLRGDQPDKLAGFLTRNGGFATEPFEVKGFTLFHSVLHSDGAVHDPLADYTLDGGTVPPPRA